MHEPGSRVKENDSLAVLETLSSVHSTKTRRTPEVYAALDYLEPLAFEKYPLRQILRHGLDSTDRAGRSAVVYASLNEIKRVVVAEK